MKAMVCIATQRPLVERDVPVPVPGPGQVLIRVAACGVCRTDLHLVDGELVGARPGVIPGHEIVGRIAERGPDVTAEAFRIGDRVGVPWLGYTCGNCDPCRQGRENLCDAARFTGLQIDGGYAEYAVADARYCFPIPAEYGDAAAAPLLCAGLIGYRALKQTGDAHSVGLYGFGAAAHITAQIAIAEGREVLAFTRPGDQEAQQLARRLGAAWVGDSSQSPPWALDAAIVFAPVGSLVPTALAAVRKGGCVVCAGIHMSDIPAFPYRLLWGERVLRSVAHLTRRDGLEFMALAARIRIHTEVHEFALCAANVALGQLRHGAFAGAAVLVNDMS
jgi:propanol-preferring alcohol dehydrogenase